MGRIFNRQHQKRKRQHLRTHGTHAEVLLWIGLKERQMEGVKFRRQFGILEYVADFYCPELRLAIEIDGISHDTSVARAHDLFRQRAIESLGIRVIRFRDEDVNKHLDGIMERIREEVITRKKEL